MSRRTNKEMDEIAARVISLSEVNPTLSDAALARHFDISPSTVSKILLDRSKKKELAPLPDWVTQKPPAEKVPDNFSHHVILYAKGWYGHSGNIIDDLRMLLASYAGLEPQYIPDRDIYRMLADAFAECVTNKYDLSEGIMEMLGKKWVPPFDRFNGKPEEAMLGKLGIVDGCYCDPRQRLNVPSFDPVEPEKKA